MKPSKDLGGFVVFDNLDIYRMFCYRITCINSNRGELFVDYSGLTSKNKFINKDANKRCKSKA